MNRKALSWEYLFFLVKSITEYNSKKNTLSPEPGSIWITHRKVRIKKRRNDLDDEQDEWEELARRALKLLKGRHGTNTGYTWESLENQQWTCSHDSIDSSVRVCRCTPLLPALRWGGRGRQIWDWGQSGLHREFLASQGYIVRSCLKQTEKSQIPVRIGWIETKIKELTLTWQLRIS